jgi:hypothetical protein
VEHPGVPRIEASGAPWVDCLGMHEMSQLPAIAATAWELLAIFQNQNVLPGIAGLQFFDFADVGNDGPMNANELAWDQSLANGANALAHQVAFLSAVHANVVGFRLNPVNLAQIKKYDAAAGFDHQPFCPSVRHQSSVQDKSVVGRMSIRA